MQREMASLIQHERSLCRGCHQSLDMSLRGDVTWLVDDDVCTSCKAMSGVMDRWQKEAEDGKAPQMLHGRLFRVRPKGGASGGRE